MKRTLSFTIVIALMLCSVSAIAEEWICGSCNAAAQGNFCSNCGTPKSEEWKCTACGNVVEGNFCSNCGASKENNTSSSVSNSGETFVDKDFEYRVLDDGTVEIVKYNGTESTVTISSSVNDYEITRIGDSAFRDNQTVEGFVMWAKLVSIGDYAFAGCTNLKNMTIPGTTTSIGISCFEGCSSLDSLIVWAKLIEVPAFAFKGCEKLVSFSFPSEATIIGESAFENCYSFESAIFWGGEVIGKSAFKNCTSLKSISLPQTITTIDESAFEGCTSLENVIMWNKAASVGNNAFLNCPYSGKYDIPGYTESEVAAESTNAAEVATESIEEPVILEGIRPEFKEALESYEAFFDEYCVLMKKSTENPSDMTILADLSGYLMKYGEMTEKLEALDDGDLSEEELKLYVEVNARITQKMIDAAY